MNWMPEFLRQRTDVDFTGYDITGSNIEMHKKKFIRRPWIFKVSNVIYSSNFLLMTHFSNMILWQIQSQESLTLSSPGTPSCTYSSLTLERSGHTFRRVVAPILWWRLSQINTTRRSALEAFTRPDTDQSTSSDLHSLFQLLFVLAKILTRKICSSFCTNYHQCL